MKLKENLIRRNKRKKEATDKTAPDGAFFIHIQKDREKHQAEDYLPAN
jgi:hypothetical protein